MLDYEPKLHIEFALQLLEGDVTFLSKRYFIDGYDQDDLQQELRLHLWQKLNNYNYDKAGIRAWANQVMRNKLRDLLRKQNRKKRGIFIEFNDLQGEEVDLDLLIDKFNEKHKKLEDFL